MAVLWCSGSIVWRYRSAAIPLRYDDSTKPHSDVVDLGTDEENAHAHICHSSRK